MAISAEPAQKPARQLPAGAIWDVGLDGLLFELDDIQRMKGQWVRLTVDYFAFNNGLDLNTNLAVAKKLKAAKQAGLKTILTIKFTTKHVKSLKSQDEFEREMGNLHRFLDLYYPSIDILIIGNDVLNSHFPVEKQLTLLSFYQQVSQRIRSYQQLMFEQKSWPVKPILMATPTYPVNTETQTILKQYMSFFSSLDWVEGFDIQFRYSSTENALNRFKQIAALAGPGKQIIVSKLTNPKRWRDIQMMPIPKVLSERFNRPANWTLKQYLTHLQTYPASAEEWYSFLTASPWYEQHLQELRDVYQQIAQEPQFMAAMLPLYQGRYRKQLVSYDIPQSLLGAIANRTLSDRTRTGKYKFNYGLSELYLGLQDSLSSPKQVPSNVDLSTTTSL